ncbi:YraN family protein [Hominifimenecus sp. rT4P-3]|uniref:YraN family protein n=1 Tax=Hominifimenecus sp. rT4P-3 TaxID=3242979 RepID=UPI003DA2A1CD
MNQREVGGRFEEQAAAYLQEQGIQILERNFRCRIGEIDLVAKEGEYFLFVEVKYRGSSRFGRPEEAVNPRKQKKICQVAQAYLQRHGLPEETYCRFDVVAVDGRGQLTYFRNAFGGI